MSAEETKQVIMQYLDSKHSDISVLADDVVFIDMSSGERHQGPKAVAQMLNYVYHIAFDADAETRNLVFADGKAVLEADFVGKHIGEFAGVPPTSKDVRIPLCVVYDLENDKIKQARVYFTIPVFLEQVK